MELDFLLKAKDIPADGLSARKLNSLITYQPRPHQSIELEITTRCNLSCPTCPRVTHHASWINRDMSMDHFHKLSNVFEQFEMIHFRGWGEPLLNPCFPEMVRTAYQSGARLVLTTNGSLPMPAGLLPYFEAIIFRLDYGLASAYERRNPEARFNKAIFNISQVLHTRDTNGETRPKIILLFAKHKYSLRELPSYLETAIRLRPDRVVFYPPMFHVRELDATAQLPSDIGPELIAHMDDKLEAMAEAEHIEMVNLPVNASESCENVCPYESKPDLYVNWLGKAAACRHSCLPIAGDAYIRYINGQEFHRENRYMGNLLKQSLETVLAVKNDNKSGTPCQIAAAPHRKKPRRVHSEVSPATCGRKGGLVFLDAAGRSGVR